MEWLAKLLVGSALSPIINAALGWQKQKLEAAGSHEARIAELAQQQLALDRREAEVQADIVKAEQGNWFTRWQRPMFGGAAVVLTWKLLVWDLALGQWTSGHTDKIGPQAYWLLTTIVIAYMGGRSAEKIADKIAGAFKK